VLTRSVITPPKVNRFDEIGNGVSQMLGLALTNFGRDPRSSESLRESRNFVFCHANNARFHRRLEFYYIVTDCLRRCNKSYMLRNVLTMSICCRLVAAVAQNVRFVVL